MKRKPLVAAAAALCLCLTLTACSPKETLKPIILKVCTMLGLVSEDADDDTDTRVFAEDGGEVVFPAGMDTSAARFVSYAEGSTMYASFNGVQMGNTDFFVAGSDSVTLTSYATTEATKETYMYYKLAVWQLTDDHTKVAYVPESTTYFRADGDCRSVTISGLTPGKQYKVTLSYDASSVYVTGGLTVSGLGSAELESLEESK